jgi:tetratricopeptide (TPR) repeat protein
MRNGKSLHHHNGLPTGAAPDWDRLLLAGPDKIFKGLRSWLGPKRAEDTEVERGYWRALVARGDTEELVAAVVERLDLDSDRLLDLDAIDLPPVRESLEQAARERLDRLDLPYDERERVRKHSFLLAETAFEAQGDLYPALALYTLIHDSRLGADTFSLYEEVLLRFKVGNVLLLLDERPERRWRCVGFVRQASELADILGERSEAPREALRALILEIRIWLGHRQEELGDLQAAAECFRAAVTYSRTLDDRVTCAARAASALAACSRVKEAREILLSVQEEVGQVEDDMVRELWEGVFWSLGGGAG